MKLPSLTSSKNPLENKVTGRVSRIHSRSQFSALEARTLYSADLGMAGSLALEGNSSKTSTDLGLSKTAAYGQDKQGTDNTIAASKAQGSEQESANDVLHLIDEVSRSTEEPNLEIVLIDSRVPNIESLRNEFQRQIDAGRNLAILVINSDTDGILRTTQMLSFSGQKVSALHIISHGQAGAFSLGSASFTSRSIEQRSGDITAWSRHLTPDADILIYGCEVAARPQGQHMLTRLGELTGADISASTDLTGAEELGGDWDLEYQSGKIDAQILVKSDLQMHWRYLLVGVDSGELDVNQNQTGDQLGGTLGNSHKSIAVNDAGDVAVTWQDQAQGKVKVRLFHPDGSARTNEITVFDPMAEAISPAVDITRATPVVAVRADGSFVVSWVQRHLSISDKIHAQRYTAEGIALGSRIDVDGAFTNDYLRLPDIAVDDSGGFVIAYQVAAGSGVPENGNYNVKASGFNADGTTRFTNIQVGNATSNFEGEASVSVMPNGSFVVAWNGYSALSGSYGIYGQRFNANGVALASQFLVNTGLFGNQTQPNVASSDDGSFRISYTTERLTGSFPSFTVVGSDIAMRSFAANGMPSGSETIVAGASEGLWNTASSLAIDPSQPNRMIVVWASSDEADGSLTHIQASGYNGLGRQGGVYDITSSSTVTSNRVSVATNGNLVAINYSSLPSTGLDPGYDVHLVTNFANPTDYQEVAPSNMIPLTQTVDEDGTLLFTLSGLGNAIQMGDSDSEGERLSVSISIPAGSGELRIPSPTSVSPVGSLLHYAGAISGTTLSFQGTVSELNLALAQLQYSPGANFNGTVALQLTTTELYGANPQSDSDTIIVNVAPVNDPISVTLALTTTTATEGILTKIGAPGRIVVNDIDAGSSNVTYSITGTHGFLTVPSTGAMSISTIDYVSGSERIRGVSLMGSLSDINLALEGLNYQSDAGFSGIETLAIFVTDNGNTGSGGTKTASASLDVDVDVTQSNINPSFVWAPSLTASVDEDSSNPLASLFGIPALSISDPDAGSNKLTLNLTVNHGALSALTVPSGLVYAGGAVGVVGPFSASSFAVEGTLAELNDFIGNLYYSPDANYFGNDTLKIQIDDLQGSLGSIAAETRSITISPVNDRPTLAIGPMVLAPAEDVATRLGDIFSSISVNDLDVGSGEVAVTVQVNTGLLHLDVFGLGLTDAVTGLPLTVNQDGPTISFRGTLSAVNAALPRIFFQSASDANGSGYSLTVSVNDLGNGSLGGTLPLADTSSQSFNVSAVNDAPTIFVGTVLGSIVEDTPVRLASLFAGASGLSVDDLDANGGMLKLTVSVNTGTLSLDPTGLTLASTVPAGSTLQIQASLLDLNSALQRIIFQPALNSVSDVTLHMQINDLGNSGQLATPGMNGEASAPAQTLSVAGVNDAPVISFGGTITPVKEDTGTSLGSIFSTISVTDVDAGNGNLLITLSAVQGKLSLNTNGLGLYDAQTGLPLTGLMSAAPTLTFLAPLAQANAAIPSVVFTPDLNSDGNGFSVTLDVSDEGNTGAPLGLTQQVASVAYFAVQGVNDVPVITLGTIQATIPEDTSTALGSIVSSIIINDIDAGPDLISVTVLASKGTLTLATTSLGLFDSSGNALSGVISGTSISFIASQSVANSVLPQIFFQPNTNANGTGFGVTLKVDDLGNSGIPGTVNGPISKAINFGVAALNDAPVNTAPSSFTGLEDTPLIFNVSGGNQLSVSDPDGNVSVEIRLQVGHGQLSLNSLSGLSFSQGDGLSDSTLVFSGTLSDVNSALNGLRYLADQNFSGSDSLVFATSDRGNSGAGGVKSAQSNVSLEIQSVNDLPSVLAATNLDLMAGTTRLFDGTGLNSVDLESDSKSLIYTLGNLPTLGELLLNGQPMALGGQFTQDDVDKGALGYRGFVQSAGVDQIILTVRDADSGSTPPIMISVTLRQNPSYFSGATGGANGPSVSNGQTSTANLSSNTQSSNATTGTASASAKTASESTQSGAPILAASPAAGAGGPPVAGAAPESKPGTTVSESAAGKASERANALAALSNQPNSTIRVRQEVSRLPEFALSPISLGSNLPAMQAMAAMPATEIPGKGSEIENGSVVQPGSFAGINLPAQAPLVERMVGDGKFQKDIEKVREDVMAVAAIDRGVVASTIGVSASFTIGYILWLVRGGVLISSLLASLPAWKMVDPLPILGSLGKGRNDDESLEEMLDGRHQAILDDPDFADEKGDLEPDRKLEQEAAVA